MFSSKAVLKISTYLLLRISSPFYIAKYFYSSHTIYFSSFQTTNLYMFVYIEFSFVGYLPPNRVLRPFVDSLLSEILLEFYPSILIMRMWYSLYFLLCDSGHVFSPVSTVFSCILSKGSYFPASLGFSIWSHLLTHLEGSTWLLNTWIALFLSF